MATTAGGGKKSMILKLEQQQRKIALASQERSRTKQHTLVSSFMNTKEANKNKNFDSIILEDSQSLSNTYNTANDFFGPPSKHQYQMLDQY